MASNDCINEIKEAAGVDLTDDELTDLVEYLDNVKRQRMARGGQDTIEEALLNAADEIADGIMAAKLIEKRNHLINIQRKASLKRLIDTADREMQDPSMGLQAATVGSKRVFEGSSMSVDSRGKALTSEYLGGLLADLKKENLILEFNSKEFEFDLARDLAAITNPDAVPSGNPKTRKIAEIVDKYRKAAIGRQNRAGAWIKPLKGYITRQSHDMAKIARVKPEEYKAAILPLLDHDATFKGVDADEYLDSVYDALSSGVHLKHGADNTSLFAFKGPGNLAKRISQSRSLHFKDADAFMEYNNLFGTRSLTEGIFQDLDRAARSTALLETFGTNPRAMYDSLIDEMRGKYRNDPEKLAKLNAKSMIYQFEAIDGTMDIAANPSWAAAMANVRSVQTMAKLGGVVLSALPDVGFQASEIHRAGIPLMSAWGKSFQNVVDGLATPADKKEFSDLLGVGLDGQIGEIATRFSGQDDLGGTMSKLMRIYFKANLLTQWTDANKRGFGLMFARELGMKKDIPFNELHPDLSRMMSRYGIDSPKWDIIRQASLADESGKHFLMPNEIKNLPNSLFTGTPRQIQKQKDELETAIRTMIIDRTDFAVITPGARERANPFLGGGTQKGTVVGEAVRFMAQFKSFGFVAWNKGISETAFFKGEKEFLKAMRSGNGEIKALASLMIGTTLLGFVSQSAKEAVKGKKYRDPAKLSTWTAAFLQGGGLGIYGDFLVGESNRFGGSLLDTLAGPTFGMVSEVHKIKSMAQSGDDYKAQLLHLTMSNAPFLNLFYTRAALDYALLYQLQEAASPGYLHRMERRIKKENNQEFIIPPSQVVGR